MTAERRIALFIDFENLVTNTGVSASKFDLQPSLDRLLEKGKVVFRRAYCDWARFREATRTLHEAGVELVDVPPSTRAGKNSADIRLVIDALELCYAREHIDTFVIASGDSDFCPLAYKLRENNKIVIGLAIKEATSPFFVKACDEFIYLKPDTERRGEEKAEGAKDGGRRGRGGRGRRGGRGAEKTEKGEKAELPETGEVPEVAREVVHNLLAAATQPINPSFIKETIVRKEPDFDERDHGFSSFNKLLAAMEREGLLRRQQHGRQWYVVPPEAAPESEASDQPESIDQMEPVEPEPAPAQRDDEGH
ncbi:MAG: NYN domain-containing protein [Deltaproteobacteria bacterium]|nr:NYN domain-containing protein [Deltaproteobacteria bacterium]